MDLKKKLLIIDDEKELVDILALRFRMHNLAVDCAYDGNDGLKKVRDFKPDIILVDVSMPIMSGWDLCEILRQDEETKDIPVIMMTAFTSDETKIKADAIGIKHLVFKPFQSSNLVSLVESLLQ
ncbi:MAG: response regulator [Chlamydiota bacterium]|nr:response regulator [Chlamydiota bacterium]